MRCDNEVNIINICIVFPKITWCNSCCLFTAAKECLLHQTGHQVQFAASKWNFSPRALNRK